MAIIINPSFAHSKSGLFQDRDSLLKVTSPGKKNVETGNPFDKVDLESFPIKTGDISSGSYGKTYTYHEDVSAFTADTKIAYEGEDGSTMFIHFSYKAVSRKVHYEVVQSFGWTGDAPGIYSHPLHDNFGPKATAERILGVARGLVNKFKAMEGDDKEKLGTFVRKLIKAIDKGFREARIALGVIPQDIGGMIQETYGRVMKGMALLGMESSGHHKLTYQEEITYTSASLEISIVT